MCRRRGLERTKPAGWEPVGGSLRRGTEHSRDKTLLEWNGWMHTNTWLRNAAGPSALSKGSPKRVRAREWDLRVSNPWEGVPVSAPGPRPPPRIQVCARGWTRALHPGWAAAGFCRTRAAHSCIRMRPRVSWGHLRNREGPKTGSGLVVPGACLRGFTAWGGRATHILEPPRGAQGRECPSSGMTSDSGAPGPHLAPPGGHSSLAGLARGRPAPASFMLWVRGLGVSTVKMGDMGKFQAGATSSPPSVWVVQLPGTCS